MLIKMGQTLPNSTFWFSAEARDGGHSNKENKHDKMSLPGIGSLPAHCADNR